VLSDKGESCIPWATTPLTASPRISAGDVSRLADRDTMKARLAEDRAGDGYRGGPGRGVGDGGWNDMP